MAWAGRALRAAGGASCGALLAAGHRSGRTAAADGPPPPLWEDTWGPGGALRNRLAAIDVEIWKNQVQQRPRQRPVRLFLIRHAESAMNVQPDLIGGRSNSAKITPLGRRQAEALGERLQRGKTRFDLVFSSTAERAKATAAIVCEHIGMNRSEVVGTPAVLEICQGEWTGSPRAEIYTPETVAQIERELMFFRPPGVAVQDDSAAGESQYEVEERMWRFIDPLLSSTAPGSGPQNELRVAVFCHGVAIRTFVRRCLGQGPLSAMHSQTPNCSVTELLYVPCVGGRYDHNLAGWQLLRLGDAAHLEGL